MLAWYWISGSSLTGERRRERGSASALTSHEVTVIKALMRRAEAFRAMNQLSKARDDLTRAVQMDVEGKRRTDLLRLIKEITAEDANRELEQSTVTRAPPSLLALI